MQPSPALIIVLGLPGSGKSTLARRLARMADSDWFSSDTVRTELGLRGDYSPGAIDRVYFELFERARNSLDQGGRVLLDASFSSGRFRDQAVDLAQAAGAPVAVIRMAADEEATLARVSRRRRSSEAGEYAYRLLASKFDPVEMEHLLLDSSRASVGRLLRRAAGYLKERGILTDA